MKNLELKSQLYLACSEIVAEKITEVEHRDNTLKRDLLSETKSSAGDKHETARAMIHLEIEKLAAQKRELKIMKSKLAMIKVEYVSDIVKTGSLVFTDKERYYISISVGQVKIGGELYYAISPSSPLGKLLIGKGPGSSVRFRDRSLQILQVQ